MSVRQRSKLSSFSFDFASARVPTLCTPSPILTRVSSSSSRMSGSAATTRTWAARAAPRCSARFIEAARRDSCGARLPHRYPEVRAGAFVDVLQNGAVGGAELAREIQAQSRALAIGGEKRLEQLALAPRPHPRGRVDHAQFPMVGQIGERDAHPAQLGAG